MHLYVFWYLFYLLCIPYEEMKSNSTFTKHTVFFNIVRIFSVIIQSIVWI